MNTSYSTIITKNTLSTCIVVSTIITLGLICFVGETFCCPGCMDNSLHASQKYPYTCEKECDLKQFHHVECSCPCERYGFDPVKYTCLKCGHYHCPKHLPVTFKDSDTQEQYLDCPCE